MNIFKIMLIAGLTTNLAIAVDSKNDKTPAKAASKKFTKTTKKVVEAPKKEEPVEFSDKVPVECKGEKVNVEQGIPKACLSKMFYKFDMKVERNPELMTDMNVIIKGFAPEECISMINKPSEPQIAGKKYILKITAPSKYHADVMNCFFREPNDKACSKINHKCKNFNDPLITIKNVETGSVVLQSASDNPEEVIREELIGTTRSAQDLAEDECTKDLTTQRENLKIVCKDATKDPTKMAAFLKQFKELDAATKENLLMDSEAVNKSLVSGVIALVKIYEEQIDNADSEKELKRLEGELKTFIKKDLKGKELKDTKEEAEVLLASIGKKKVVVKHFAVAKDIEKLMTEGKFDTALNKIHSAQNDLDMQTIKFYGDSEGAEIIISMRQQYLEITKQILEAKKKKSGQSGQGASVAGFGASTGFQQAGPINFGALSTAGGVPQQMYGQQMVGNPFMAQQLQQQMMYQQPMYMQQQQMMPLGYMPQQPMYNTGYGGGGFGGGMYMPTPSFNMQIGMF